MSVFGLLFEMKEHPIAQQIAQPKFWFRAVVYLALGIFVLGYVNWKQKEKQGRN
jgi:cadmium resistance protein CadD (predicted permease)